MEQKLVCCGDIEKNYIAKRVHFNLLPCETRKIIDASFVVYQLHF